MKLLTMLAVAPTEHPRAIRTRDAAALSTFGRQSKEGMLVYSLGMAKDWSPFNPAEHVIYRGQALCLSKLHFPSGKTGKHRPTLCRRDGL